MRSRAVSRVVSVLGFAASLALAAACDKGLADEPEQVAANCPAVVQAICDAACECGGAVGCAIAGDSGDPEDWIAFDDKSECVTVYSLSCGSRSGNSDVDYKACAQSLNEPACQPTSGGQAFAFPDTCKPPPGMP